MTSIRDNLTIRDLGANDADALYAFYQGLSEAVTFLFRPFGDADEKTLRQHVDEAAGGRHISIGVVGPDGVIVGHCFILNIDTDQPVFGVGLDESVHGLGLGKEMTEHILAKADRRNLPVVTLTVLKCNTRAQALYRAMGFVQTGEATFREENDSLFMVRRVENEL